MAILEGTDKRYFEIVTLGGESVLALFVGSISEGGYVLVDSWNFAEVEEALKRH